MHGVRARRPWLELTQNSKDESVGKVAIKRQFDHVSSDAKSASCLNQRHENPPTNRGIENGQWDAGYELLFAWVSLTLRQQYWDSISNNIGTAKLAMVTS